MPDRPLVSVVIPVYNGERFLAEAIDSALGQDYEPVEVIVVDDGSTDGSAAIAARYGDGVRWISQTNAGVSSARNAGLAATRGELIAFLDQDDLFAPNKLTMQVASLTADPELDFVTGRLRLQLEPGSPRPSWWNPSWDPDGEVAVQLGTALIRRRAFDMVGGFDERYAIAGDSDWIARAKDAGLGWQVLPNVVLTYRVHEHNNVHDQAALRREMLQVMRASVHRQRAPLVSVVIAVRDGERYLAEAIDSALAQSHPRVEVVVVDDGSEDDSAAIAARFGGPVRWVSQPPLGIGAARNRGVELARGDFLAFLDADDLWPVARLERQLSAFSAEPGLEAVFGHVSMFRAAGVLEAPQPGHSSGTVLVRRSAWHRVGGFSTQWPVGEFLDWLLRARDAGLREAVLPDTVHHRRIHGENHTARRRSELGAYAHVLKASLDRRRAAAPKEPS